MLAKHIDGFKGYCDVAAVPKVHQRFLCFSDAKHPMIGFLAQVLLDFTRSDIASSSLNMNLELLFE